MQGSNRNNFPQMFGPTSLVLKKYELISKPSHNKFSTTCQAKSKDTKEFVLIKALSAIHYQNQELAQERIAQEITVLSQCGSSHIINYIEHFVEGNVTYLVTELAEQTLAQYIMFSKPKEEDCRQILKQILIALAHLHLKVKAIHRDIKLENIMLRGKEWKLIDLGFCKQLEEDSLTETRLGNRYGMAPQVEARLPYNRTADVWSVGVVYYFMLFKKYPFNDLDLEKKKTGTYEMGPCSPESADFIRKTLEFDPKKRLDWPELAEHPIVKPTEGEVNLIDAQFEHRTSRNFSANLEILQLKAIYGSSNENIIKNNREILDLCLLMFNKISTYYHFLIEKAAVYLKSCNGGDKQYEHRSILVPFLKLCRYYMLHTRVFAEGDLVIEGKDKITSNPNNLAVGDPNYVSTIFTKQQLDEYQRCPLKVIDHSYFKALDDCSWSMYRKCTRNFTRHPSDKIINKKISYDSLKRHYEDLYARLQTIKGRLEHPKDIKIIDELLRFIMQVSTEQNDGFLNSITKHAQLYTFRRKYPYLRIELAKPDKKPS